MAEVPVLDWRCTQCGEAMTWQLVKPQPGQEQSAARRHDAGGPDA